MPDDEVEKLIDEMKKELEQRKYYPEEFKSIILILMDINNPNYGLIYDDSKMTTTMIFDSTNDAQFVKMSSVEKETVKYYYKEWPPVDVSEYIDVMVEYLEHMNYKFTKNMIKLVTDDGQFAYKYRKLTMPLINMI